VPKTGLGINGPYGGVGDFPDDLMHGGGGQGEGMDNFTFSVLNSLGRITRGSVVFIYIPLAHHQY
jgi:hypothetical protein